MKEFAGKVAVVTGAGGGIGRGLARRCAQEGMKVVLAGTAQRTRLIAQTLRVESQRDLNLPDGD